MLLRAEALATLHYSLLLALGVACCACFAGVYTAWLVVRYEFPARRYLEWALLLPLAVPGYLLAMIYGHLLDVAGPVQEWIRTQSGLHYGEYWFPDIRSLGGAIMVLSLALYPYVYLLARHAFSRQCASQYEAAYLLGLLPSRWLWRIAIPAARPAIAAGAALVTMEALADFGTVSLFGVPSFTTHIYRAWSSMFDPSAAARLSLMLLLMVCVALWLERYSRRHLTATQAISDRSGLPRQLALSWQKWAYVFACALPVVLGFAYPIIQLIYWSGLRPESWMDIRHWHAAGYSMWVGIMAGGICIAVALLFAYALRGGARRWHRRLMQMATLGYAIPGSVIAVAIFMPLLWVDRYSSDVMESLFGYRPGLWLTGSIAAMTIACALRFLAVAHASIESGLQQIPRQLDESGQLLGCPPRQIMRYIHAPLMWGPLLIGFFLVFADTVKELPASLLLRPFNVDTLAIRAHELAKDGLFAQASAPALMLIAMGIGAVIITGYMQFRMPKRPVQDRSVA